MAGHVQDRWWRDKMDEGGAVVLNAKGKPVRERTPLYGKGMRYKVRYYVDGKETSESFPDKQLGRAQTFLSKVQIDILTGTYADPDAGKVRLRSFVGGYLKGQTEDPLSRRTIESKFENMVYPFFGDPFLAQVTIDRIRDWLEWMRKRDGRRPTSASYRAQTFDLVSAVLSAAADERKILSNPCKAKPIKRPNRKSGRSCPGRRRSCGR